MRTLLIDGDTLIFEAAAANEYECQWDEWMFTLHGDLIAAIAQLDSSLAEIKDGLKADRVVIALSDTTRWRPAVMPTYKGNRKSRKPVTYNALREYCHEKYTTYQRPTLEGDDVLGILATHPKIIEGEKIVVSIDKDMQTIPGWHVNYAKARGTENWEDSLLGIAPALADYHHMMQTLTGDTTDGYPGCPGVGPVSGAKLLEAAWGEDHSIFDTEKAWKIVLAAYAKKGLGEEVALQNARVARICRHTDYDFTKKEVILWAPNA